MNEHAISRVSARRTALGAAVAFALLPLAMPAALYAADLPSYATGEESISGRIVALDGTHQLQLKDDRGFIDTVTLHDGTVINPTGLRLAPGQSVKILGHARGKAFEANEVDTPYSSYPGVAPYAYAPYGYGYGAPYAYAPYGYYAPYGPYYGYPGFSLGIGFGGRGRFR